MQNGSISEGSSPDCSKGANKKRPGRSLLVPMNR